MRRRKSVFAPTQELFARRLAAALRAGGRHRKLEIADWSALPDDQVLRAELRDVIHQAIQELPEIYRAVILLRDVEELNTDEAAQKSWMSRPSRSRPGSIGPAWRCARSWTSI